MNEAKQNAVLSKRVNHNGKPMAKKEFVEDLVNKGYEPATQVVKAVKDPTRTQFNRMDGREQAAFEKRQKEAGKKTEYLIKDRNQNSHYVVTKAEHDYAKSLTDKKFNDELLKENIKRGQETALNTGKDNYGNKLTDEQKDNLQKSLDAKNETKTADTEKTFSEKDITPDMEENIHEYLDNRKAQKEAYGSRTRENINKRSYLDKMSRVISTRFDDKVRKVVEAQTGKLSEADFHNYFGGFLEGNINYQSKELSQLPEFLKSKLRGYNDFLDRGERFKSYSQRRREISY